jgi:phosphoglycerate dehydrogenase-like enzyme
MKKIGLSHNLPLESVADLLTDFEVICPEKSLEAFSEEQIHGILSEVEGFICIADTPFEKKEFDKAPKLSFLGNLGSGFNNVDIEEATRRSIPVLNTPTAVVNPTAENTLSLLLSITRGTVRYDRNLRENGICPKELLSYTDMTLYGKTLGIVGYGRIGKRVGQLAQGFGMNVIHYDPSSPDSIDFNQLLAQSDVVTLHVPYFENTHHLINRETIALMKPSAYLLNVSRGAIVEEKALVEALQERKIRGAALDVHEFEPTVSKEIRALDNIVITPHISTNLAEVRLSMLRELAQGFNTIVTEKKLPRNTVNLKQLQTKE